MSSTIGTRIKILRNELGLSMAAFGDKIKMTNSNISKMEKNLRAVTDRTITIICKEFNVSEKWLLTGEGEMFVGNDETIIEELVNEYNLDDLDKKIIEQFVKLDNKQRQSINKYVLALIESEANDSEITATSDENIKAELENYRQELEAEKKVKISSVLEKQKKGLLGWRGE